MDFIKCAACRQCLYFPETLPRCYKVLARASLLATAPCLLEKELNPSKGDIGYFPTVFVGHTLPCGVVARQILLWVTTEVGRLAWIRELTAVSGGKSGSLTRVKHQMVLSSLTLTQHLQGRSARRRSASTTPRRERSSIRFGLHPGGGA